MIYFVTIVRVGGLDSGCYNLLGQVRTPRDQFFYGGYLLTGENKLLRSRWSSAENRLKSYRAVSNGDRGRKRSRFDGKFVSKTAGIASRGKKILLYDDGSVTQLL